MSMDCTRDRDAEATILRLTAARSFDARWPMIRSDAIDTDQHWTKHWTLSSASGVPPQRYPGAPHLLLAELRYRILPDGTEVPDAAVYA